MVQMTETAFAMDPVVARLPEGLRGVSGLHFNTLAWAPNPLLPCEPAENCQV